MVLARDVVTCAAPLTVDLLRYSLASGQIQLTSKPQLPFVTASDPPA